jgi:hypothetical protein
MQVDIDTIQADITNCQHRVRALQAETIHTITIKPSGKIEVVDKAQLESLNDEIDHLNELAGHNSGVLARLIETLGEGVTVQSVRDQKKRLEDQINKTESLLRVDIGNTIRRTPGIDPTKSLDHPKIKALRDTADATFAGLRPRLEGTKDLLEKAEAVLQDFRPSECHADVNISTGLITREKVGGMA